MFNNLDDYDCYSLGSNINFTLGHSNELERVYPELIEQFKKTNISIKQISMSNFHTLFLDSNGRVYSCGHGKDGRLGHGNEETYMLPTLISSMSNENCVYLSASANNSYFVLQDGTLKSCGTNEFKQLGQLGEQKCSTPKFCSMKTLKNVKIDKIECGRFHCALLSNEFDVYTFGLNAGQIGHAKEIVPTTGNIYIQEARLVKELAKLQLKFDLIACSVGATICLDQKSKRIVYLLNDYKCKRLSIAPEIIKKIRVTGDKLDHQVNSEISIGPQLTGDPITIVCLTATNSLIIWKEDDQQWRQLYWNLNKKIKIIDFDLNRHGLILSTIEGLCYRVDFNKSKFMKQMSNNKQQQHRPRLSNSNDFNLVTNDSSSSIISSSNELTKIELLDLNQIPLLNRSCHVFSDPKGKNYSVLQYLPYSNMKLYPLSEPSTIKSDFNSFYSQNFQASSSGDITILYKNKKFYLDKFILMSRCVKFFTKYDLSQLKEFNLGEVLGSGDSSKYDLKTIEMLFSFIYSGQYKQFNELLKFNNIQSLNQLNKYFQQLKELADKFYLVDLKKQVIDEILKKLKQNEVTTKNETQQLRQFVETNVNVLSARLKVSFMRLNFENLFDCEIKCNNGEIIKCHKCVLISRSDYFSNMFEGYWMESRVNRIDLPHDYDLLRIIIDYLYQDDIIIDFEGENSIPIDSNKAKIDKEIEILFNLYVLSDQLLLFRIKNLCEFKLSNLVNLKNCVEIYQFSFNYEAKQLNEFCLEFIVNNLITLIESKLIENLDFEMLNEVTRFYCKYFSQVGSRRITPYSDGLDCSTIDLIPLDLLYDEKFVDGTYFDNELNFIRKKFTSNINQNSKVETEEPILNDSIKTEENSKVSSLINFEINQTVAVESVKWEKVKKKVKTKSKLKILFFISYHL